jgi:hypothetical protein
MQASAQTLPKATFKKKHLVSDLMNQRAGCGDKMPMACIVAYVEHWTDLLLEEYWTDLSRRSNYRKAIGEADEKCQK